MRSFRRWNLGVATLGVGLAVTGCSAPANLPFQQRGAGLAAYGYSEVKLDASHYSVSYSDNVAKSADNFLELRAAQIAQAAGSRYFAFDSRGSNVLRHTENDIGYANVARQQTPGGGVRHTRDMIPQGMPISFTRYYYAWGRIVLLTDDQVHGNAKALQASEVLARPVTALAN